MSNKTKLPALGILINGGFFAGVILIDGTQYGLAVAPKAEGEMQGAWGERGKSIEAKHVADGMANTKVMAESKSDIAKWALDLKINDQDDWYIPARDELELIYRNLKPTSRDNFCSYRDSENPNSVPPRLMHEDKTPAQTSVTEFQEGGAESMSTNDWYYSSTQTGAYYAFIQDFSDGCQYDHNKANSRRVRAVRRFLID